MKHLAGLILGVALTVAGSTVATHASNVSLPVYPGAPKSKNPALSVTATRCGHKVSNTVYSPVDAGVKTVSDWYTARIPGSVRVDYTSSGGGALIFAPSGAGVVAISGSIAKSAAGPVFLNLATYGPPLSSSERQMMQELVGSDPAARQRASAEMKAKCGPNSTL